MKKSIIAGGILISCGLLIFCVGMFFMNWNFKELSTMPEYKNVNKEIVSIKDINLDDKNIPVLINKSIDNNIHLSYYENDREYYEFNENESTVTINKVKNYKWYDYLFNINFQSTKFVISLPESYYANIDIKTSNSRIELDSVAANNIALKTSHGRITIKNVTAQNSLSAVTSNARVTLDNAYAVNDFMIETSNAAVEAQNISSNKLSIDSSNGDITAKKTISPQSLFLNTSNSKIVVEDVLSDNICLESSNGDIEGNIIGAMNEYSITSKTSNGDNNLPSSMLSGNKILNVKTSNSDIELYFSR